METFFLGSFIAVSWAFSVYLAWHLGRLWEYRKEDLAMRRRMASLFE